MLSSGNVIGTFFYYISHTNNFFWENILEDIAETLGNISTSSLPKIVLANFPKMC